MSIYLQLILFLASLGLTVFVTRSVKKAKMRIEDAFFWVVLSFFILLLSVFPQIGYWCADVLGFQAPINFIMLFFIFVLLVKGFITSRHASELETKVRELSEQIAYDRLDHYERTHVK
ncbi:DUF2304 domain-containing protein [Hugonella massiliensis]|uniref:DUF2304 domain-containing protein n=1 Tax=Hugonella massiliensis TaxID=1720315 RepID=UPI00073F5CE0|nr:DUF2304 domain-containing protein [Hugonella massiliensis]